MSNLAGMGLVQAPDPKDADFPIIVKATKRTSRHWPTGPAIDQDSTPHCVGYAGFKYLHASPIINKPKGLTPKRLYDLSQQVDEWPGPPPAYEGTSIRALCKVLKRDGYILEYRWANTLDQIVTHILNDGPMIFCSPWLREMSMPDRWGFLEAEGQEDGWHAYLLPGCNERKKHPLTGETGAVRGLNSWGEGFADKGRFWLPYSSIAKLLALGAFGAATTEILRK